LEGLVKESPFVRESLPPHETIIWSHYIYIIKSGLSYMYRLN